MSLLTDDQHGRGSGTNTIPWTSPFPSLFSLFPKYTPYSDTAGATKIQAMHTMWMHSLIKTLATEVNSFYFTGGWSNPNPGLNGFMMLLTSWDDPENISDVANTQVMARWGVGRGHVVEVVEGPADMAPSAGLQLLVAPVKDQHMAGRFTWATSWPCSLKMAFFSWRQRATTSRSVCWSNPLVALRFRITLDTTWTFELFWISEMLCLTEHKTVEKQWALKSHFRKHRCFRIFLFEAMTLDFTSYSNTTE